MAVQAHVLLPVVEWVKGRSPKCQNCGVVFSILFCIGAKSLARVPLVFLTDVCLALLQKVRQKNQEMKVLMDQMRNLLWDVNAMLTLRK